MPDIIHPNYLKDLVDIDPQTAVAEIDKRYTEYWEPQIKKAAREAAEKATDKERSYRHNIIDSCNKVGESLTALAVVAGIVGAIWLVSLPSRNDTATMNSFLHSCKTGDTVGCIAAVQDQQRQCRTSDGKMDENSYFADNVELYKQAYLMATGKPLPLPGGYKESTYNGLNIQETQDGVEITNSGVDIVVKNTTPEPSPSPAPAPAPKQ